MTASYFELFRLEPRFALASEQLDTAYRSVASQVHPDKFVQSDPREQRRALELSALANEAYSQLKRAVTRARHLLGLKGIAPAKGSALPAAMLMLQMEWREALEEAQNARDLRELESLENRVQARSEVLHSELASQLDVAHDFGGAAHNVEELSFIEKLLQDIDEARALLDC